MQLGPVVHNRDGVFLLRILKDRSIRPMTKEDNITFTINQVAKMIGVVPATIRNWEKNDLIRVKRSESNYRIFTPDDIETLKKIKAYSNDKHMGQHAIKVLLPKPDPDSDVEWFVTQQKESFFSKKLMSEKWRQIRKEKGYTLEDVSKAVGISVAHLSNLENGGNMSLGLLNKLAHFYEESPLYFMNPSDSENRLVRKGAGDPIRLDNKPGIEMTSLIALQEHMMYPVLCTVEPGYGNLTPHTHNGEEMVYILSGTVEYRINDEPPYILKAGDTFYYKGADLHSWQNNSNKPAKLLWIHCAIAKE